MRATTSQPSPSASVRVIVCLGKFSAPGLGLRTDGWETNMPPTRPMRVLFLCTGNACRSQMAEALTRHFGGARVEAVSAGSNPAGFIHPLAVETMASMGISLEGHWSKGWDEFADTELDIVLTLCDHAAGRPCPIWHGEPVQAHWGLSDPVGIIGSDAERLAYAADVAAAIEASIQELIKIDPRALSRDEVRRRLVAIAPVEPDA